jgi:hypothetical protein
MSAMISAANSASMDAAAVAMPAPAVFAMGRHLWLTVLAAAGAASVQSWWQSRSQPCAVHAVHVEVGRAGWWHQGSAQPKEMPLLF